MKILILGDFQGVFSRKLREKLKKEEFDFVIGVGDYGGIEDWREYLQEMFKISKLTGSYLTAEEYFGEKGLQKLMKKDEQATEEVLRGINSLGKPVFYVFGNSDDEWYDYPFDNGMKAERNRKKFVKRLMNMKSINYSSVNVNGLRIVGFGGYMDVAANYKGDDKERIRRMNKRITRSKRKLELLIKRDLDILVLHYPPKGVFDIIRGKNNPYNGKSAGIPMFREVILKKKPKLVLCGHMHEYQGAKKLGRSLVVNPGDAEKGKYAIVEWPSLKVNFIK